MTDRPILTLRWRWFAVALVAGLLLWGAAGFIVEQMAFGATTHCESTTCMRKAIECHPGEYTCRQGCTGITAQMFNHVRPVEMRGSAFAAWPTRVRES